jgi:branched-chain amino acid transport system permease protein
MITLALAEIAFIIFKADDPKLKPITGGEVGIQGIYVPAAIDPTTYRLRFYFLALASMVGLYLFARRLVNSPTGRVLVAIRENEGRAIALGFNTLLYKVFATMISASMAALAGMLMVLYEKSASFEMLGVNLTIQALLMTIIGGIGTLIGPMLGAATVRLLDQWLKGAAMQAILPAWLRADLLFGLIYVALVLFFPAGLMGALRKLRGQPSRRSWQAIRQALKPKVR